MSNATPLKLSDFGVSKINVTIEASYGRKLVVSLMLLTWHQWNQPLIDIPDIPAPLTRPGEGNSKLPNPDDTRYRARMFEIGERRNAMRLLMAFEGGGNVIDGVPPDASVDQKIDAMRNTMDTGMSNALFSVLNNAVNRSKVDAKALGDMFPEVSVSPDAGAGAEGDGQES